MNSSVGSTVPSNYRAMQVSHSGALELAMRATPEPGAGEVLIALQACGICGADLAAIGAHVPDIWTPGQRVGVGRLGGPCGVCAQCRQGRFQLCANQPVVGVTCDGGYAEMMLARASGLVAIPDELKSEEAAPLLCAGIATFNALKKCGAQAGDTVAVLGIGGLGHMALQYARRMGFRVVAVGRGQDIAADARQLGAHRYIDSNKEDALEVLQSLGGVQAILTSISQPVAVSALLPALAPQGRLVLLGAGKDPLPVSSGYLVGGERSVIGSITGSPYENEKTLGFSVLAGVRPMIEVMPLEAANAAVQRLQSGTVKFRMVLTMESG